MEFFENDRFAKHNGMEIIATGKGYAKTKMTIGDRHLNGLNMVHGGAIFTLADLAFAVACNSHGNAAVAINVSISFMKAASKGNLYAEAKEISINPKISTYTINVIDDKNEIIAIFQGMAYRKKEKFEDLMKNRP